ncbi:conserved exported hypothetical protein [Paraburkholderia ribeironis]|uniref:Uncharacterized protein n=1 Tax=Paraburkholderia ribeironis TaxID=1247936 RepID=A0A1N7SIR1_9BURK|nr:hypothetical protein [Paraburkholderia ribeironis]SIT47281.1 conserved exported hypothetical protein [Paraburkholderia ribeironis]
MSTISPVKKLVIGLLSLLLLAVGIAVLVGVFGLLVKLFGPV